MSCHVLVKQPVIYDKVNDTVAAEKKIKIFD